MQVALEHNAFISVGQTGHHQGKVPVAIKDLMRIKGFPLTAGTKDLDWTGLKTEASVVSRIRSAGAEVIGTTNLHELAYGVSSRNPHHKYVQNALNRELTPGGSSGGSAVAVSLGAVPVAIGTDTAGSIRIPAACNSVVGFKPSYGALPTDGVVGLGWSLDHVGPLSANVDWTSWAFAAMSGREMSIDLKSIDTQSTKIGFLGGYFESPLDAECHEAVEFARRAALSLGYATRNGLLVKHAAMAASIQFLTLAPEATACHLARLLSSGESLGEDVRVRLEAGLFLPAFFYPRAQLIRQHLDDEVNLLFESHDVLVSSTLRCLPPRSDAHQINIEGQTFPTHTAMTQLTMPFNLTGHPAITIPIPALAGGLVSVQLVGRKGEDWRLLAVAKAFESAMAAL
jgi:aspartyl-tRNA(Asn)/glutamyl-tRNA(Gln) amidotransferase subunit A